jgi:calcium-dependent protein kinase
MRANYVRNITPLVPCAQDKNFIHFVLELCEGGELFDRIAERGKMTEKDAAAILRTIVRFIRHCHTMNVIHRDVKPEV